MNWKPIPHESPAVINLKKTHIRHRFQKHALKVRNIKPHKTSYRLLQSVGIRLLDFVKYDGKQTLKDINGLITDMQRTVANLQKKRMLILEKETHKAKNKKPKRPKFNIKRINQSSS